MNAQTGSKPLDGYVTVVTGASSGIGASIASTFSEAGSKVVLIARRKERLEKVASHIEENGGEAMVIVGDVMHYNEITGAVEKTLERFGRIDVMVNNAGYAIAKSVVDSSIEEIDGQIDVNLKAVCYGTKAVLPTMIGQQSGNIINIGSICSVRHYPDFAAYVGAKFGVLGFSRSVYEEVREHGIRVNCLCPAAVNTEWADIAGTELPWDSEVRLQPQDLAQMAMLCVTMPKRVQLEHIILWPTCEPTT